IASEVDAQRLDVVSSLALQELHEIGRAVVRRQHPPACRDRLQEVPADEPGRPRNKEVHYSPASVWSRYQSMLQRNPSSSPTSALNPSSWDAFSTSGMRISTSGPGCGRKTTCELEPVSRSTVSASPSTVTVA